MNVQIDAHFFRHFKTAVEINIIKLHCLLLKNGDFEVFVYYGTVFCKIVDIMHSKTNK